MAMDSSKRQEVIKYQDFSNRPKGEDTRNHPNRRVGRSELPRLSEALANHLNNSLDRHLEDYNNPYEDGDDFGNDNQGEEAREEFAMSHSIPSLINQPYPEAFSEIDTGEALNRYRQQRGSMDSESKELYASDIRDAYRNRYPHGNSGY
jgi:hypothetical protein